MTMESGTVSMLFRENHLEYLIVFSGWMSNHNPLFLKTIPVITILKWSFCFVKPTMTAFIKGLSQIKHAVISGKILSKP